MSTIPKEIQDKIEEKAREIYNTKRSKGWNENLCANYSFRFSEGAEYGYQLATDGREELEKEINEINNDGAAIIVDLHNKIISLQSSLKEKEKECEELKEELSRIIYISQQPGGYYP